MQRDKANVTSHACPYVMAVQRELGTALYYFVHTHLGKELMANKLKQRNTPMKRFVNCLKLYLAYGMVHAWVGQKLWKRDKILSFLRVTDSEFGTLLLQIQTQ